MYFVPNINPTNPIVVSTVEIHRKPNAIPKTTALIGLVGRKMNITMTYF